MKIERISENEIKCTLTRQDLESRHLRISELAYGSEKARALFRDMMKQAFQEVGFQADNPLMIEAIPMQGNGLVLKISKVSNPDEIDTRFAKLSPSGVSANVENDFDKVEGADDILDLFRRITEAHKKKAAAESNGPAAVGAGSAPANAGSGTGSQASVPTGSGHSASSTGSAAKGSTTQAKNRARAKETPVNLSRGFRFNELDNVINAAIALKRFYRGRNSLYRIRKSGEYVLVIHQGAHSPEEFNKVCNILSEYGSGSAVSRATEAYLAEHEETVLKHNALQQFGTF